MFVRELAQRSTAIQAKGARNNLPVFSPQTGTTVPLSQVPVVASADGSVRQGLAIRPFSGAVVAPFDATVVEVYPVSHAIVLRHVGGVEVLIHIAVGAETSNGEYFTPKVSCGQKVAAGSLLVEFDHAAIKAAGYDAVTSVIVLNGDRYPRVVPLASGSISQGEALFMAIAVENSAGASGQGGQGFLPPAPATRGWPAQRRRRR